MRLLLIALLLLLSILPACAHDQLWGFMYCYRGNVLHCEQDTLVFALVAAEDKNTYTLTVEKVLRQNAPLAAGSKIRIKKTGYEDIFRTGKAPRVGGAIVVSFLRENRRQPYQPRNLVCSTTTDWRKMSIDAPWYYSDMKAFETFVRSGPTNLPYYHYPHFKPIKPRGKAVEYKNVSHYKPQPKYLNALERRARQRHLNVPLVMSFFLPVLVFFAVGPALVIIFAIFSRRKHTPPPRRPGKR